MNILWKLPSVSTKDNYILKIHYKVNLEENQLYGYMASHVLLVVSNPPQTIFTFCEKIYASPSFSSDT